MTTTKRAPLKKRSPRKTKPAPPVRASKTNRGAVPPYSTILALDLGLSCGWAVRARDGSLESGTWLLDGGAKPPSADQEEARQRFEAKRYARLRDHLRSVVNRFHPDAIVYEKIVSGHTGTTAAHVYGALEGVLLETAQELAVPLETVAASTWKRDATGRGNITQDGYFALAQEQWPSVTTSDEAAARFIAWTRS